MPPPLANLRNMHDSHVAMIAMEPTEVVKRVVRGIGNVVVVTISGNEKARDAWEDSVMPGNSHLASVEVLQRIRDHRHAIDLARDDKATLPCMTLVLDSCGDHEIMRSDVMEDILWNPASYGIMLFMTFQNADQIPMHIRGYIRFVGIIPPGKSKYRNYVSKNATWVADKYLGGDRDIQVKDRWLRIVRAGLNAVGRVYWIDTGIFPEHSPRISMSSFA